MIDKELKQLSGDDPKVDGPKIIKSRNVSMEKKPEIPPKPKLTKSVNTDKTRIGGKKSPPRKYSAKVPVQEGETRKVLKERKSLGAIKIPGIVQRRNSLSQDKSPVNIPRTNSIKKDVKLVLPERKRLSLASTLPVKRLDNNNLTSLMDKNPNKEPSSLQASSRTGDSSMKDPKRKLSILSKTSPSLGEALKRSNSACKPAPGPQSKLFNVRRKSSDNILDKPAPVSSQGSRATQISNLKRGKLVSAGRGKTQSPGLVKQDLAKSKSEIRAPVHPQSKVASDKSENSDVPQSKLKPTRGATQTKDSKPSVVSPGLRHDQFAQKNRTLVSTRDSSLKSTPKSLMTKPLQRSQSDVLSEKKLNGSKHSPRVLNPGLSGIKKVTPVPLSSSGQKRSSLEVDAKIEYSINGLSSQSQEDKDKETIQGLKKTLEDNMEKFNVMVLCFLNAISKNDELKLRLANRNEEVQSLRGSLANLQVSVQISK